MENDNATIQLVAAGDLMLGDHPVCYGHGIRSTIEAKGFNHIVDYIAGSLREADITFGNLETVLSDIDYDAGSIESGELRGRPIDARNLSNIGFNILNFANNHCMQHGLPAFQDTVDLLSNEQIDIIGLKNGNESNVIIKEIEGVSIAFVGYSLRPEKYYRGNPPYALIDEESIFRQIKKIVKNIKGSIIVSLHWGEEYLNYPSKKQMLFGRKLIDEGVSLVLGHHPHVLQGVEEYNSGVIVYSLGNFIFDKWQRNPRESMLFACALSNTGVIDYACEPIYIERNYRITIAKGAVKERIQSNIKTYNGMLCRVMSDDDVLGSDEQYRNVAKKAYFKFRLQSYLYFIVHILKYNPADVYSSALRFVKRRLGVA
jgi:poly-gamma-glutamate synthesis protein (capsule biosynthesis protein)